MSETDRRKFLAVAGGGAAAVGLIGVTAGSASASAGATARKDAAHEPVVAYIEDHRSGRLRLMVGDHEVLVHDRDLVTRILNAAGGE